MEIGSAELCSSTGKKKFAKIEGWLLANSFGRAVYLLWWAGLPLINSKPKIWCLGKKGWRRFWFVAVAGCICSDKMHG